jgi:hypothetical protein
MSRLVAVLLGKMPTTSVRRLISLFSRSSRLLDQICRQWATGKAVKARMSGPDSARSAAACGKRSIGAAAGAVDVQALRETTSAQAASPAANAPPGWHAHQMRARCLLIWAEVRCRA